MSSPGRRRALEARRDEGGPSRFGTTRRGLDERSHDKQPGHPPGRHNPDPVSASDDLPAARCRRRISRPAAALQHSGGAGDRAHGLRSGAGRRCHGCSRCDARAPPGGARCSRRLREAERPHPCGGHRPRFAADPRKRGDTHPALTCGRQHAAPSVRRRWQPSRACSAIRTFQFPRSWPATAREST